MRVEWMPRAVKDLERLPGDVQVRVTDGVGRFTDTGHGDVRRVQGRNPPEYRLRVGDYRVFFARTHDLLLVLRVLHRKDAY